MELCKFCRDIYLQAAFPPPGPYGSRGYRHQPDLANMIQAAGSGCELCQFFLKCAEGLSQKDFDEVQKGGQLYLRSRWGETMSIVTYGQLPISVRVRSSLCYFECFAPDSSKSCPLSMQMPLLTNLRNFTLYQTEDRDAQCKFIIRYLLCKNNYVADAVHH